MLRGWLCQCGILPDEADDGGELGAQVLMNICALNSFFFFNIPELKNQKKLRNIEKAFTTHPVFIKTVIQAFISFSTTPGKRNAFDFYHYVSGGCIYSAPEHVVRLQPGSGF